MPSYRFCRPDDIPFLVRAVNQCYNVHFPSLPEMTVERFRDEMRVLNLWPSNSMVARDGDHPVAVMIGTKRADEVLILRLGVHPDHQRQGHGSHLLTSLSQKLAVLGPPRLIAEVPTALPGIADFLHKVHYHLETTYTDHVWHPERVEPVPEGLVIPVSVQDLLDNEALTVSGDVAWRRSRETLVNAKDELHGLAIASPERIEAYLLHPAPESVLQDPIHQDILALGCSSPDPQRRKLFSSCLLRELATRSAGRPLRLPRLTVAEAEGLGVEELGFVASATYQRYAAVASPG